MSVFAQTFRVLLYKNINKEEIPPKKINYKNTG